MVTANYPCTQQELYTSCTLGWQSCLQQVDAFSSFSPMYTTALIEERQAEVTAAMNLPDEEARRAESQIIRVDLDQLADTGLANWQRLKRYVIKAYAPEYQKIRLNEAGQSYYEKAANKDWEAVKSLLLNGNSFISNNLDTLTGNLNMPPSFQDTFEENKDEFLQRHQEFLDSEENVSIATQEKGLANNDIHKKLMEMFLDGQDIFKNDEALRKQFVFEQVLGLVSGTGTAGIRGTITNSVTGAPVANALITFLQIEKDGTTDDDGKYSITEVAAGSYTITISAPGYQEKTITVKVKVGTISTVNETLAVV